MKAFTFWANGYIPENKAINDLTIDLENGIRLIALVETLTKTKLTQKYKANPKNRVHYIENISLALAHLGKYSKIKVGNYGNEGSPKIFRNAIFIF